MSRNLIDEIETITAYGTPNTRRCYGADLLGRALGHEFGGTLSDLNTPGVVEIYRLATITMTPAQRVIVGQSAASAATL